MPSCMPLISSSTSCCMLDDDVTLRAAQGRTGDPPGAKSEFLAPPYQFHPPITARSCLPLVRALRSLRTGLRQVSFFRYRRSCLAMQHPCLLLCWRSVAWDPACLPGAVSALAALPSLPRCISQEHPNAASRISFASICDRSVIDLCAGQDAPFCKLGRTQGGNVAAAF